MSEHEGSRAAPSRRLVPLSAPSFDLLRERATAWLASAADDASFAAACDATTAAAPTGPHRLAFAAATASEAAAKLGAYLEGKRPPGLYDGVAAAPRPRVAFLFTGQGSQYAGMGRELYETQPVFRLAFAACAEIVAPELPVPLTDVMFGTAGDQGLIDQTLYTQPALFALEYALAELLAAWGIAADLVLGHSVGEYVAACRAQVFSRADGMRLIATRARLMQSLPPGGTMAAVGLSATALAPKIEAYRDDIAIAAINGDDAVVLSGDGERMARVVADLTASRVKVTMLMVSHAFHSPLLASMLDAFTEAASSIRFAPPAIDLVSNVTGQLATAEVCTPQYWRRHVRQAVLFADGMRSAYARGCRIFVELGPNPVLLGMARPLLANDVVMIPTLRRRRSDREQLLDAAAELFVRGIDLRGSALSSAAALAPVPAA